MPEKVAAYLRASQDREGLGYSVDRQREDIERLCEGRDWVIAETFVDNDVSATSRKPRPAFNAMMAKVDAGEFNIICARHMDRLLRRLSELETVLERCAATNTSIVTASDGVDTSTDGGRLVARILSSVAQGEVERKAARQRSAVVQAAKQGRWVGGRRPFGYESDGMTVRESEAALIRQAYADVIAGESLLEVARRWTAAGAVTTQGSTVWRHSTVKDILTNPRNCGLRRHRTQEERADIRGNPELGIVGKAEWPPIVDEGTWRAAVRITCDPKRRNRHVGGKGMLTGIARCGECGQTVNRGAARRDKPTYRCPSQKHVSRLLAPVDEWVSEVAIAALSKPGAAQLWATVDVTDLLAEADRLRGRLADLDDDYARMSRDRWRALNDQLQAELTEVEAKLAASTPGAPLGQMVTARDPRAVWETLTVPQRRWIIATIMDVTLLPPGRGVRQFNPETVVCTPKVSK